MIYMHPIYLLVQLDGCGIAEVYPKLLQGEM